MPQIQIPTPLRKYTDDEKIVEATAGNVGEALQSLVEKHPGIESHLYDGSELRTFVNIYVDKQDIRHLDGDLTPLREDSVVLVIPSIAGG